MSALELSGGAREVDRRLARYVDVIVGDEDGGRGDDASLGPDRLLAW